MEKSSFKIAAIFFVLLFLASDIENIGTEARNVVDPSCHSDADCDLCGKIPCTICKCMAKKCYCSKKDGAGGFFAVAIPKKTKLD